MNTPIDIDLHQVLIRTLIDIDLHQVLIRTLIVELALSCPGNYGHSANAFSMSLDQGSLL
jgi:hypothetical protein